MYCYKNAFNLVNIYVWVKQYGYYKFTKILKRPLKKLKFEYNNFVYNIFETEKKHYGFKIVVKKF